MYVVMNGRRVEELREEPVLTRTAWRIAETLEVNPKSIAQVYYTPERAAHMRAVAAEIVLSERG